jgi:hypothetical protein
MWIAEEDLLAQFKEQGWHVLSSEGAKTQYLWVTARKPCEDSAGSEVGQSISVESVVGNSGSREIVAGGPLGFATMMVSGLADSLCSITHLSVLVGGSLVPIRYISPRRTGDLRQLNIQIPRSIGLGQQPLIIYFGDRAVSSPFLVDIHPSPPLRPFLVSITDGEEVTIHDKVRHGRVQVTISGCTDIATFRAVTAGQTLQNIGTFCEDPIEQRYKINLITPPHGWSDYTECRHGLMA